MSRLFLLGLAIFILPLSAQEQVDKPDAEGKASSLLSKLFLRVRVTKAVPEQTEVHINWRRGGEGLGGSVTRSFFLGADKEFEIAFGEWSDWYALETIVGRGRGWSFPTIVAEGVVSDVPAKGRAAGKTVLPDDKAIDLDKLLKDADAKGKVARRGVPLGDLVELEPAKGAPGKATAKKQGVPLSETVVELEFAEGKKAFKRFAEAAPKGATVGFAFPGAALGEAVTPDFIAQLNGISTHARARRERLEKLFPDPAPMPRQFALIGHLGGYGEGVPGKGGGSGYGVRHCNPEIVADECRTLRMLGVNGLTGSVRLADAAGFGGDFRRAFWGGPGSGSPMAMLHQGAGQPEPEVGCPFDPALKPAMQQRLGATIEEYRTVAAQESWGLWTDEIGVFAKSHIVNCERCPGKFRDYLRAQGLSPADFGRKTWEEVKPANIWAAPAEGGRSAKKAPAETKVPDSAADSLCQYYTARFMTHATAQVFPEAARKLKDAGILLYAMQGPTPSWSGSSLDWHEFYDTGANTAFVFETSNRDPRVWQWESYLADLGRGIAARHGMPMGCLIKPHRGAPAQRMLSVVSRGVRAFEWYTYGPDYSKGDSFSQSPELLERVARAARFLGKAEERLFGARFAGEPEVAFVSPRSSEIWGRTLEPGGTAFENAKWVWTALAHAHIPVDILSEQQLAEGKLGRYKAIYVPGTHLRRDAAAKLKEWVMAGGSLWTDAFGLARDETNQPATALAEVLGLGPRQLEMWGSVEGYRAVGLNPMKESDVPAGASLTSEGGRIQASIGREVLAPWTAEVLVRFADGQPAVTRNRFGRGDATVVGIWSGLTYSAKVRRADFSMRDDFSPATRALIAGTARVRKVYQPVQVSEPLVEAVSLEANGRRSVALMNWAYHRPAATGGKGELQAVENLRVDLAGVGPVKSVRSLLLGELPVANGGVVLPKLAEIDLLWIE
jgi:hypothetical protein